MQTRARFGLGLGMFVLALLALLGRDAAASTSSLQVTVTDSVSTYGIPGASVEISNAGGTSAAYGFANAQGQITFVGLNQEDYRIFTTALGYPGKFSQSGSLAVGANTCAVTLAPFGTIAGTIDTAQANVRIWLFISASSPDNRDSSVAVTNSLGAFTLANVKPATYTVVADGFDAGLSTAIATGVVVTAGQTTVLSSSLAVGGTQGAIAGQVTFNYTYGPGTPTGNANEPAGSVEVFALKNDIAYGRATTNSTGNYSIPRLPPGTYSVGSETIYCSATGADDIRDPGIELRMGMSSGVSVTASSTTTHNGTLTRSAGFLVDVKDSVTGANLLGCTLEVRDAQSALIPTEIIYTADSYWSFSQLPAGTYSIKVLKAGYLSQTLSSVSLLAGSRYFDIFDLVAE